MHVYIYINMYVDIDIDKHIYKYVPAKSGWGFITLG
jgi:hypothetical protein